jgi:NTP pyrophosphatase (non-canonical NTP hydrolase)
MMKERQLDAEQKRLFGDIEVYATEGLDAAEAGEAEDAAADSETAAGETIDAANTEEAGEVIDAANTNEAGEEVVKDGE